MQQRKQPRASDGKQRHGFGKAVDRGAPLLVQQQQDGGYKGSSVADSNPPDKIDDCEAPRHRNVDAPNPNPDGEQIAHGEEQHHHEKESDAETEPPYARLRSSENDRAD